MHNFLRYLEDRSDNGNGAVVNYAGSMISMYYSQYATGKLKHSRRFITRRRNETISLTRNS